MDKEKLVEIVFLSIVFGVLVFIGPGAVFQNELNHDKPVQFAAGDGYLYGKLVTYAYDTGDFRNLPPYSSAGYTDSLSYHPPFMSVLVAGLGTASGISAIDAMALIMALGIIFGALMVYWLIRSWNKHAAMLSSALFVFLYVSRFSIGYTWGQVVFHMGTFFLIAFFFIMSKTDIKHWWIPAGILIAGTINSHFPATIFLYGFVGFFLLIKFVFKQLPKQDFKWWAKQIALATVLAIVLSFNHLIIFGAGYGQNPSNQLQYVGAMAPENFPALRVPPFQEFTIPIVVVILAGVVLAFILARKKAHPAMIMGGYMFLVGLMNYLGLEGFFYRAFQTRYIWPVYLAVFFGLTLVFILKYITKNTVIIAILGLVLTGFFVSQYYTPLRAEMIQDGQWEGVKWLYDNTLETDRVLFFPGDGYNQWVRLVKRPNFLIDANDLVNMVQSNELRRMIKTEPFVVNDQHLLYRKGLFSFGRYADEQNITIYPDFFDVCDYEYYVLDRTSAYQPALAQLNVQFANLFVANNMSIEYQNNNLVILKNHNPGDECLAA